MYSISSQAIFFGLKEEERKKVRDKQRNRNMETLKRNGWHEVENEREEDGEIVKNLQR